LLLFPLGTIDIIPKRAYNISRRGQENTNTEEIKMKMTDKQIQEYREWETERIQKVLAEIDRQWNTENRNEEAVFDFIQQRFAITFTCDLYKNVTEVNYRLWDSSDLTTLSVEPDEEAGEKELVAKGLLNIHLFLKWESAGEIAIALTEKVWG
jgi:hypothetical protein